MIRLQDGSYGPSTDTIDLDRFIARPGTRANVSKINYVTRHYWPPPVIIHKLQGIIKDFVWVREMEGGLDPVFKKIMTHFRSARAVCQSHVYEQNSSRLLPIQ